MRRMLVGLAVTVMLGVAPAATPSPATSSWVRRETQHWVVYLPNDDWNVVDGANGTDISSPLGELAVGLGFAGWTYPLKTSDILDYAVRNGTLDGHPIANLRVTRQGRATHPAPAQTQQIYAWSAFRTDRKEKVRGIYKVNVLNDYANGVYAYSAWSRIAPAAVWARITPTLLFIEKHITFKPRTPTCVRWEPGCPLRR